MSRGLCPIEQKLDIVRNWKVPQDVKGIQSFSRICQLLSEVHTTMCQSSLPIDRVDQQGCGMAMGTLPTIGIPRIKTEIMDSINSAMSQSIIALHSCDRCINNYSKAVLM